MKREVCEAVNNYIQSCARPFEIIWHGGEPMAIGLQEFSRLFNQFSCEQVRHSIQTNATLIDDDWCEFFKANNISVGVSIDGNRQMNTNRVNWSNKDSFDKATAGISKLIQHNIQFSIISVVSADHLDHPIELYKFFSNIGCWSWGINIEEFEANNTRDNNFDINKVMNFWTTLFKCWKENPKIRIREFDYVLTWMDKVKYQPDFERINRKIEAFPSVNCDGDVILLSPEFLDVDLLGYNFVVGNVLSNNLCSILEDVEKYQYVREFSAGVQKCSQECSYFSFCGGGYASNKFFENKTLNSSVTRQCINTKQQLVDSVIKTMFYE